MNFIKKIGNFLEAVYDTCYKYVKMTLLVTTVSFLVAIGVWKIWDYNMEQLKATVPAAPPTAGLLVIHDRIAQVTDVSNRVPPIMMLASLSSLYDVNAFTTGQAVYFTYATDSMLSDDEKALIMGHEIAHVILHHTDNAYQMFVSNYSNEDELMADNLGAVWADKAGYDVCKGRETFKKFYQWSGNSLNSSHPPNLYRYENLAHYCKGK